MSAGTGSMSTLVVKEAGSSRRQELFDPSEDAEFLPSRKQF